MIITTTHRLVDKFPESIVKWCRSTKSIRKAQCLLVRIDSRNRYSVYEIIPLSRSVLNREVEPCFSAGVWSFTCATSCCESILRFSRGRGSCSTTLSKKSCGVMYSCPSKSTEANLMKRRSRAVNLTAFSWSSCKQRSPQKFNHGYASNIHSKSYAARYLSITFDASWPFDGRPNLIHCRLLRSGDLLAPLRVSSSNENAFHLPIDIYLRPARNPGIHKS